MALIRLALLSLLLTTALPSHAAAMQLNASTPASMPLTELAAFHDQGGTLNWQQALTALQHSHRRSAAEGETPLGFFSGAWWFLARVDISAADTPWLLGVSRPHVDTIDLFTVDAHGNLLNHQQQGDQVSWPDKALDTVDTVFPLLPGNQQLLLIRVESVGSVQFSAHAMRALDYERDRARRLMINGLLYGVIIALLIYNGFIFLEVRDQRYFWYLMYLATFSLFVLTRDGYLGHVLSGAVPVINLIQNSAASLAIGFFFLFVDRFLESDRFPPGIGRFLKGFALLNVAMVPLAALYPSPLLFTIITAYLAVGIPALFSIMLFYSASGDRPAQLLLLSLLAPLLMITLFVTANLGLIAGNWLVDHSLKIGTAVEGLLLSLALGYRFSALQSENARIQAQTRRELEQRVEERTHDLHAALRSRDEFLAMMSHEVRTPLNGILGTTEILADRISDEADQHHLKVIEGSGRALLSLINDVLDYSRIESGRMPISNESFNIAATAEDVALLFEPRAREHDNRLTFTSTLAQPYCLGDPVRTRQLLQNLVSNAVKFTEQGRIDIHLSRDEVNADYVLISVSDTGVGIARDEQAQIFESFKQSSHMISRRMGGSGLGLAICKQLAELMGGEIGVSSTLGQGSRFWVRLPMPACQQPDAPADDSQWCPELPACRLLVVDDNQVNLTVTAALAEKLGHSAVTTDSGAEALAIIQNDDQPFDCILMDCEMPIMDGFQTTIALKRLQSQGKAADVPVVALSAYVTPDKIQQCLASGMAAHLAKPLRKEKLQRVLADVVFPGRFPAAGEGQPS